MQSISTLQGSVGILNRNLIHCSARATTMALVAAAQTQGLTARIPRLPACRHRIVCAAAVLVQAARTAAGMGMAALHAWLLP